MNARNRNAAKITKCIAPYAPGAHVTRFKVRVTGSNETYKRALGQRFRWPIVPGTASCGFTSRLVVSRRKPKASSRFGNACRHTRVK